MSSNSSSEPSCCLGYARNDRETKTPGGQVNGKKDRKSPEEKGRERNVTGLRKERNLLNYGLFSAPNCTSCRVMFGELLLPEASCRRSRGAAHQKSLSSHPLPPA